MNETHTHTLALALTLTLMRVAFPMTNFKRAFLFPLTRNKPSTLALAFYTVSHSFMSIWFGFCFGCLRFVVVLRCVL